MSRPLERGAYRKVRPGSSYRSLPTVAVRDFSGLVSRTWALANAAAREAIDSLERCMIGLHLYHLEADCPGLGALGPDAVAERLLGVLRHQPLELGLRFFMIEERRPGRAEHHCELCPGVGLAHIDDPYRLDLIRGRGGSTPNRRGGSPNVTQRQNFFSAVSR